MRHTVRSMVLMAALLLPGGCSARIPAAPSQAAPMRTQALEGPTELLVKFKVHTSPQQVASLESTYGLRQKEVITAIDVHVMTITTGEQASDVADRVETSGLVVYAEPNHRLTLK